MLNNAAHLQADIPSALRDADMMSEKRSIDRETGCGYPPCKVLYK